MSTKHYTFYNLIKNFTCGLYNNTYNMIDDLIITAVLMLDIIARTLPLLTLYGYSGNYIFSATGFRVCKIYST